VLSGSFGYGIAAAAPGNMTSSCTVGLGSFCIAPKQSDDLHSLHSKDVLYRLSKNANKSRVSTRANQQSFLHSQNHHLANHRNSVVVISAPRIGRTNNVATLPCEIIQQFNLNKKISKQNCLRS